VDKPIVPYPHNGILLHNKRNELWVDTITLKLSNTIFSWWKKMKESIHMNIHCVQANYCLITHGEGTV
jgi:hypothetical protein